MKFYNNGIMTRWCLVFTVGICLYLLSHSYLKHLKNSYTKLGIFFLCVKHLTSVGKTKTATYFTLSSQRIILIIHKNYTSGLSGDWWSHLPPTSTGRWHPWIFQHRIFDTYIYNVKVEQYVVSTLNIIWSRYVGTYCELF